MAANKTKKSGTHGIRSLVEKKTPAGPPIAADPHETAIIDRRGSHERRRGEDRRTTSSPVAVERRMGERRAKVNRRRQIDPTTCERDYTPDEIEFMNAMDAYKRRSGRMFPTCSEVLEVLKSLGYVKQPAAPVAMTGDSPPVLSEPAAPEPDAALAI